MHCIVSAIPSEIKALVKITGLEYRLGSSYCVDENRKIVLAHVGVGYLEAAINLQKLILRFPIIKRVTFCGTAGIYPDVTDLKTGETCQCSQVILSDASAEIGSSAYVPLLQRAQLDADIIEINSLKRAKVVTTLSITTDDNCSREIRKNTRYEIENMELYGIAFLCNSLKIPWNAILGLTNYVGSTGREEWLSNHLEMEKKMNQFLTTFYII